MFFCILISFKAYFLTSSPYHELMLSTFEKKQMQYMYQPPLLKICLHK